MAAVVIPDRPFKMGKTRSEHARNLRSEGWSAGLTVEQEDKCRFLERKLGVTNRFLKLNDIDKVR